MTISIATAISIPALFQSYPICLQVLRIRHSSVSFKMYFELCVFFQTVALNFALFMRQCDFRKNYRSFEIFGGFVCFVGILIVPKKKETDFGG